MDRKHLILLVVFVLLLSVFVFGSPTIDSISDNPDPIYINNNITIYANVSDPLGVDQVWVNISDVNYSMSSSTDSLYPSLVLCLNLAYLPQLSIVAKSSRSSEKYSSTPMK